MENLGLLGIHKNKKIILLISISILVVIMVLFKSRPDNLWVQMAKDDLLYIKNTVEENHPGFVDPNNKEFNVRLNLAYERAIQQLQYVQSLDGVLNLLNEFSASFSDSHFDVHFRFMPTNKAWAGIKIEKKHSKYIVTKLADSWPVELPELDWELTSCDGKDVQEIMNNEILRYRYANYKDNYPQVYYASKIFIDDGIGYRTRPGSCAFKDQSGKQRLVPTLWQYYSDQLSNEWDVSVRKPDDFYLEHLDERTLWVRIPDFMPQGTNLTKLESIIKTLSGTNLSADKRVVFDIRGNFGGNSIYGTDLQIAVYTKGVIASLFADNINGDAQVLWRASDANLQEIHKQKLNLTSENINTLHYLNELEANMTLALREKEAFALQPSYDFGFSSKDERAMDEIIKSLPRVAVITDKFCGSACLDFLIPILSTPNTIHLGAETFADSQYNQPRSVELPSRLGFFRFPQKIAGQRGPFRPSVLYEGDMNDTESLKKWYLNTDKN